MSVQTEPRDLYLKDLDQQTDATWRVLEGAIGQRDLIAKMHGASVAATVAIVVFLGGRIAPEVSAPIAGVVLGMLCGATYILLGSLQGLRMQQILLSHAAGHAAMLLEGNSSHPRRFFSLPRDKKNRVKIRVQKLGLQSDPMAIAVKAARTMFLADGVLAASILAASAGLCYGLVGPWALTLVPLALAIGLGVFVLDRRFVHEVAEDENDLARWLASRFRDLRVAAIVDSDWSGKPEWEIDLEDRLLDTAAENA